MHTANAEEANLKRVLPADYMPEDVQYHLYVIEKVQRGIKRAASEGVFTQREVERRFCL